MWIDSNLPPEVVSRIEPLCAAGDQLVDGREFGLAIQMFREALEILPSPPHQWVAATWILTAIGDTAYYAGDLDTAEATFREITTQCRGWQGSPIIALRRGQIAYDRGDMPLAADCLASAFIMSGYDILTTVEEKYASFVLGQLDAPVPPMEHPLAKFHRTPKPVEEMAPPKQVQGSQDGVVTSVTEFEMGPGIETGAGTEVKPRLGSAAEPVAEAAMPSVEAAKTETASPEPPKKKRPWWKFW